MNYANPSIEKIERLGIFILKHISLFLYLNGIGEFNYEYNEDLINIANAISIVVLMDQNIVAKDKNEFKKRLKQIILMKEKLPAEKLELIIEWLQEVFRKRFPENIQENIM